MKLTIRRDMTTIDTQKFVDELNQMIQDQFTQNEIERKLNELTHIKINIDLFFGGAETWPKAED